MQFSYQATRRIATHKRRASINAVLTIGLCAIAAGSFYAAARIGSSDEVRHGSAQSQQTESSIEPASKAELPAKYPVTIRKPSGPPKVFTGMTDPHGQAVTVSCSTCHATREANFSNKTVADLDEFHGTLKLAHGTISCLSCHNANDYDSLKLADGTRVEYTNVMTLCAQCHGPQMRDYEHNVHGGMNGHWDLTKGPRTKNNCVDCHNPHSPQFPKMQPTFKPKDRFLDAE